MSFQGFQTRSCVPVIRKRKTQCCRPGVVPAMVHSCSVTCCNDSDDI
ncbi:hypothetical protein I552_6542 [Mycobacterium xenopi 3993]|nr:hypothetical protein I552_6542 [Mycobacterium xenopi 3993]